MYNDNIYMPRYNLKLLRILCSTDRQLYLQSYFKRFSGCHRNLPKQANVAYLSYFHSIHSWTHKMYQQNTILSIWSKCILRKVHLKLYFIHWEIYTLTSKMTLLPQKKGLDVRIMLAHNSVISMSK